MTKKLVPMSILAVAAVAAVGCGTSNKPTGPAGGTGSFDLNLTIPDGRMVTQLDLTLVCPDSFVNQMHPLNVANGDVVATFGGLAPGACTATLSTVTSDGYNCQGTAMFTVVAGTVLPVPVTLTCQGTNTTPSGGVKITAGFGQNTCAADRIQKLFAIPSNVLTGGPATKAEGELNTANVVGTPVFSWALRNDATHTATGTLGSTTCSPNSASCQSFACTGLGSSVTTVNGLPTASVFVALTVEDGECFDTEEVLIDCSQASVCGDGIEAGAEQCDDSNIVSNDGCSATCRDEFCGDMVLQTSEQCDGVLGVGPGQSCHPTTCQIINNPICGDGMKNQLSEQCDGTDGLLAGQVCGSPTSGATACKIIPVCHNGHVEGTEQCDTGPDSATCVSCQTVAPPSQCDTCLANNSGYQSYNASACQPDTLCVAVRTCILANPTCWSGAQGTLGCYCGLNQTSVDSCENSTFVPTGPCKDQIRAGGGGASASNADVVNSYNNPAFGTGNATLLMSAAFDSCQAQCFP